MSSTQLLKFIIHWVSNWLTQRITVNGVISGWQPITSGVPQGSILGQCSLGIKSILQKFASYTKVGGTVSPLKGRENLQKEVDKLERWQSPTA